MRGNGNEQRRGGRGNGKNGCCEEGKRKRCCEQVRETADVNNTVQAKKNFTEDGKRVIRCAGGDD